MFVPVYVTSPLTGFIRPSSVFINVVLPAPFAPSRQMILPVLNRRLMLLTIGEPLYPIERFVADITGIIHPSRKAGLKAKARMPCPQTRALQCRRYFTLSGRKRNNMSGNRMTVAPCYLDSPKLSIGQRNEPAHHPQGRCVRLPSHTCRHRSFFPKKASTIRVNMATSDDSSAVSLAICDARSFSCLETICQFNLQPASRTTRFQTIFVRDHYPL